MAWLSVIAPGATVRVKSLSAAAKVTGVRVKAGLHPVTYDVEWTDGGGKHTGRFHAAAVELPDAEPQPEATLNPQQVATLQQLAALVTNGDDHARADS